MDLFINRIVSKIVSDDVSNIEHKTIYTDSIYTDSIYTLIKQSGFGLCNVSSDINTSIQPLSVISSPMNYIDVETLAFHLSLQLRLLEERGFSLLFLQPSDILVVSVPVQVQKETSSGCSGCSSGCSGCLYIIANMKQLVPLHKKNRNTIVLTYPTVYPFPKEVCAPEVMNMSVLPFITHKSAIYYSMALLCLRMLRMLSLDDLRGTKLYYFLRRCMKENPEERITNFF